MAAGTMRRCKHGVYIGAFDPGPHSPYCSGCNPNGAPVRTRDIELPIVQAERYGRHAGGCPNCGELAHVVAKDESADTCRYWECAACGKKYPARRIVQEAAAHE